MSRYCPEAHTRSADAPASAGGFAPGQTAYTTRFADRKPRDITPWEDLPDDAKATWARVEEAVRAQSTPLHLNVTSGGAVDDETPIERFCRETYERSKADGSLDRLRALFARYAQIDPDFLQSDATARQRGKNLDGSVRRETVERCAQIAESREGSYWKHPTQIAHEIRALEAAPPAPPREDAKAGGSVDEIGRVARDLCSKICGTDGPCPECTAEDEPGWRRDAEAKLAALTPSKLVRPLDATGGGRAEWLRSQLETIRTLTDIPTHKRNDTEFLRACAFQACAQAKHALQPPPRDGGQATGAEPDGAALAEARAVIEGFLACEAISDVLLQDQDPETIAVERRACKWLATLRTSAPPAQPNEAQVEAGAWLDISTAPKGLRVLIHDELWGVTEALQFDGGVWGVSMFNGTVVEAGNPLAWQPLPSPPSPDAAPRAGGERRMAEGCCSAIFPCSHQQRDPYTICKHCTVAWAHEKHTKELAAQAATRTRYQFCEIGEGEGWKDCTRAQYDRYAHDPHIDTRIVETTASPSVRDGGEVERATLTERFAACAEKLEAVETLPKPYDLYYAVKNAGEGTGWTYRCVGLGVSDIRSAAAALATTAPAAGQGDAVHYGWLYHNPDTGEEWAENHPVESGEVDDAERVRPATLRNLHAELTEAWRAAELERADREALATHPAPKIESPRDLAAVRAVIEPFAVDDPSWEGEPDSLAVSLQAFDEGQCPYVMLGDIRRAKRLVATLDAAPAPDPASAGDRSGQDDAGVRAELARVEHGALMLTDGVGQKIIFDEKHIRQIWQILLEQAFAQLAVENAEIKRPRSWLRPDWRDTEIERLSGRVLATEEGLARITVENAKLKALKGFGDNQIARLEEDLARVRRSCGIHASRVDALRPIAQALVKCITSDNPKLWDTNLATVEIGLLRKLKVALDAPSQGASNTELRPVDSNGDFICPRFPDDAQCDRAPCSTCPGPTQTRDAR